MKEQTILIVDDELKNIQLLNHMLNPIYKIRTALNGKEALDRVVLRPLPHLILLDIMMPGIDGFEVCRKLKENPLTEKIPVIFITAKSDIVDETRGLEMGAVDYINKPVSEPIVKARVKAQIMLSDQRIASEILIRERTREIEQLQEQQQVIIDFMPSILIGIDSDKKIRFWNKKAFEKTGLASDSVTGKNLLSVYPQLIKEISIINDVIDTGKERFISKRAYFEEGEIKYEDIIIYSLSQDKNISAMIRIDDKTELVRMEELVIQNDKMLSLGGLAAGMAHEINNPLAGILQTVSAMSNRFGEKINMQANIKAAELAGTTVESINSFLAHRGFLQMLENISQSGVRAMTIIENMLGFSRKSKGIFSSSSIISLLNKTLILASSDFNLSQKYDFKCVQISTDIEDNIPDIFCDTIQIQQVLLNILLNGAQAMKSAEILNPKFNIMVKYDEKIKHVIIEIRNNGPEISEESQGRIFEPFYTTKDPGEGTGLGLSVSYFIITGNHNGSLSLESSPGEGVTFIISLPVLNKG